MKKAILGKNFFQWCVSKTNLKKGHNLALIEAGDPYQQRHSYQPHIFSKFGSQKTYFLNLDCVFRRTSAAARDIGTYFLVPKTSLSKYCQVNLSADFLTQILSRKHGL